MRRTTNRMVGFVLTEHEFDVPLDHHNPGGGKISVFAREVVAPKKEKQREDLPWLVFFQGGPGFEAPRPLLYWGWLKRAVEEFRVLLLDQRGTGRSTPVTHQTLGGMTPVEQHAYLKHFRADSIVRDAELIRRELGTEPWTILGQSFGGFCAVSYLSLAPAGLSAAVITGGLPPLERPIDDVYRATYRRLADRNRRYYERYPQDVARVRQIVKTLTKEEVKLSNGERLTARRFRGLGIHFGMSDGFERVHYLIEGALLPSGELDYRFLRAFEDDLDWDTNPIYALLHEPIYAQGAAPNWSAERVLAEFPEFVKEDTVYFWGEMVYPWLFDDVRVLRPLKGAADRLAGDADWPKLYDRDALLRNVVPVVAAIYADDMYVEREFSEETAASIRGIRTLLTNEYDHNALRVDGEVLLGRLLELLRGER
jgi:pimeloyl-ACP methyl ester carboxylesterase